MYAVATTTFISLAVNSRVFASGIGTAEVKTATENIKRVITSIAMPLGSALIFASVVIAALKMIANANNPQKRAESIGSLVLYVNFYFVGQFKLYLVNESL